MATETQKMKRLGFLQRNRCYLCGKPLRWKATSHSTEKHWWPTIDHIKPRASGGSNGHWNRALAHQRCNERKAARKPTACEVLYGYVNAELLRRSTR